MYTSSLLIQSDIDNQIHRSEPLIVIDNIVHNISIGVYVGRWPEKPESRRANNLCLDVSCLYLYLINYYNTVCSTGGAKRIINT